MMGYKNAVCLLSICALVFLDFTEFVGFFQTAQHIMPLDHGEVIFSISVSTDVKKKAPVGKKEGNHFFCLPTPLEKNCISLILFYFIFPGQLTAQKSLGTNPPC